MRTLTLELGDDGQPLYRRLAGAVRRALDQRCLAPGELLPSTRDLARQLGIHRHTVLNALDELVAEGWLVAERGRGYRVVEALPSAFFQAEGQDGPVGAFPWDPVRRVDPRLTPPALRYAFPSGQPDLRCFPADEYYRLTRQVLRRKAPHRLLAYSDPSGQPALKEQLQIYLRRLRAVADGEVVVTHGSQEAIYLLGQLLLGPGDTVAVEELGYPPAWQALASSGASLAGVRVDREGIDPEHFEWLLTTRKVRMLYLTPLHQYPTTVTLPRARRAAIYELAERHRIPILEDDYDHEFHYRCQPVAPLKASDPAGLVLYCSTFSKVLFPAARLGFAVVPKPLAGPLGELKRVVSRQNDNLTQETVALWMSSGGLERHLRRMRRLYQARMARMVDCLGREGVSVQPPDGGMCLWVDFGVDSEALAAGAARREVAVQPGAAYRLEPGPCTALRLGFASSTEEEIEAGVARLCDAWREMVT
ncbi:MAG: PLP-dependent aminotransferase family protein [Candidatus Eremiobacterota bacterium]